MAILGLGTDIVEISRLEQIYERSGESLAKRVLTVNEWNDYQQSICPIRFLAKRFAAKEAASKALGTGIAKGVSFQHFEISHDEWGKPLLLLSGHAKHIADCLKITRCLLTISDEKHYAVATVLLEGADVQS